MAYIRSSMRGIVTFILSMIACCASGYADMRTDTFTFSFEGRRYSGLVDMPEHEKPRAMIVIVPGSGKTDIVAGQWFHGLRSRFAAQGFACLIWDKAGCGTSEGVFDYNQSIQSSAGEVIAAITEAASRNIPGSEKIGLWGTSRAGWICPLVIEQRPIAFWISVSGTDDKETFGYLLEKNFLIEGRSVSQTNMLMDEWRRGIEIARTGGSFAENLKATEELRKDSFYIYVTGNSVPTEEGYRQWQAKFRSGENVMDKETGLLVYVPGLDTILGNINCPVLALFGERDTQVDWRKTRDLYSKTIGTNPGASLTIRTFPDCNHNMLKCRTGDYREELDTIQPCDGYYDAMLGWLKERKLGR